MEFSKKYYPVLPETKRKRSGTIRMFLADCRAFPHDSLVWQPGQEVEGLWSGLAFNYFLNYFQVFSFSKLILEKRSGHTVKRQPGTQLLFPPCISFLAYKSGLAGGVGGGRCYQSVSQRFVLTYQTVNEPK
ncbi:hypothetical protein DJ94_4510 [Bacillus pseudomycoides]|nr:hypothetical protein DJ94_4510 [Bacillus pseudomycoides]